MGRKASWANKPHKNKTKLKEIKEWKNRHVFSSRFFFILTLFCLDFLPSSSPVFCSQLFHSSNSTSIPSRVVTFFTCNST